MNVIIRTDIGAHHGMRDQVQQWRHYWENAIEGCDKVPILGGKQQHILIRVDIGGNHGMGHAVRMLALAWELQRRGASVTFVTATDALRNYVVPFRCMVWTGDGVLSPRWPGHTLIVDTKAKDWANDESELWLSSKAGMRVVRIDNPHAMPSSCDLLIGPCAHWDAATVTRLRNGFGDRFLYGWEYVLLDPAVTHLAPETVAVREQGPIVFVAGGSDPSGVLQVMYDATASYQSPQPLVFLTGSHSAMLNPRIHVPRVSGSIIASFDRNWIRRARLLVTMFGVTSYEALWWNVPQVIFTYTYENKMGARQFAAQHPAMAVCRGDIHQETPETLRQTLEAILEEGPYVPRPAAFDGLGLQRVASTICELAISETCIQ